MLNDLISEFPRRCNSAKRLRSVRTFVCERMGIRNLGSDSFRALSSETRVLDLSYALLIPGHTLTFKIYACPMLIVQVPGAAAVVYTIQQYQDKGAEMSYPSKLSVLIFVSYFCSQDKSNAIHVTLFLTLAQVAEERRYTFF